jgi:hypothetical protein
MKVWCWLLPALVAAIYKDQAGKFDWSIYNLGQVEYLAPVSNESYLVTSQRGVLALLRSSGHIAWRKLPYGLDNPFGTASDAGTAVTWRDRVVKQWRPFDGLMLWEKSFDQEVVSVKLVTHKSLKAAAVCLEARVVMVDLADGDVLDTFKIDGQVKGLLEDAERLGIVYENSGTKVEWISENSSKIVQMTGSAGQLLMTQRTAAVFTDGRVSWQHGGKTYSQTWSYGPVISQVSELDTFLTATHTVSLMTSLYASDPCTVGAAYNSELVCLTTDLTGQVTVTYASLTLKPKLQTDLAHGEQLWAVKGASNLTYILRTADHTLVSFTAAGVKWTREEALGLITHLEFFELPGKTVHAHNAYYEALAEHDTWSDVFTNLALRVQAQAANLISSIGKSADSETPKLIRDAFGFNKVIVAVTSALKLFGIKSETGETIWSLQLPHGEVLSLAALHLEEAAIVVKTPTGCRVTLFDPVTGLVLSSTDLPDFSPLHVVKLGGESTHALLLIDAALRPVLLPDTPSTRALLAVRPRHFYRVDGDNHRADGYQISSDLILLPTWTLAFSPSEAIVAYSSSSSSHLQQPAIATGHSALLLKSTDDNLFVIATLQSRSTFRGNDSDLIVHILNGVTGQVVGKVRQEYASGPVSLLMDEYWAVACYWQYKSGRYEALSIEVFEDETTESATKIITDYYEDNRPTKFSSYLKRVPKVLSRTYAMTTGVKALSSTQTLQGITKQFVLMILNSGQIYAIDRSWLSPRRKTEEEPPSVFDEATLPTYNPVLPMVYTNIVNYDRQLEGLSAFKTTWTLLESTSILAAYGLDLYSSKVMPEGTYDMLTEEFSYTAIVLTVSLLLVVNVLGSKYFSRKELDKRFSE